MSGDTYAAVLLAASKWLTDVGMLWVVGVCVFRVLAARPAERDLPWDSLGLERRLVRQLGAALALLLIATAARLYAQTYASFGLDEPVTGELLWLVANGTRWGGRWQVQTGAIAIVAGALASLSLGPSARWRWVALGGATCAMVGVAPTTGHAFAFSGGVVLPMSLQIGHLLAAGIWLGTLLVLLSAGVRSTTTPATESGAAMSTLVDRFSPVAMTAAALLAGTGLGTAYLYVDEIPQLWGTTYGRALLLKTGLFGLTAALGAYNWRRVRPRLAEPEGVARLRRSGMAELLVAAVVLVVTAWLVHLPTPHE
ncbi:MAG: CopD family protein [Acidobacteria bacterium]|nr:CopD family protein [Acidobacteriota bacterium]